MTVLAVDGVFAVQNPATLSIILKAFSDSIKWTMDHPAEAGALAEKHELGFPREAAAKKKKKSNYVFIPAQEARSALENLYRVFLEFSPVSIGGAIPPDTFYLR
jgi:NitT/TauT family transport system substrate-binding protein